MELVSLDNNFGAKEVIENWESLNWSERYIDASDFELKTYDVRNTISALPLDSFVSLHDTREVMIVESHEVNTDEFGNETLTTTGRSAETFLEHRVSTSDPSASPPAVTPSIVSWVSANTNTTSDMMAQLIIWASVVDDNPSRIPSNVLDDVRVTRTISGSVSASSVDIVSRSDAYSEVLSVLAEAEMGIRARRWARQTESVVTFDLFGQRVLTDTQVNSGLNFDIYRGIDRRAMVVFDVGAGDFSSHRLLRTNKGFKNEARVYGDNYVTSVNRTMNMSPQPAGWGSRQQIVELSGSRIEADNNEAQRLVRRARRELRKAPRRTRLNEFELNPNSTNYIFGEDYHLGDQVSAITNFGANETLRVLEFTRSMGVNGYTIRPLLGSLE